MAAVIYIGTSGWMYDHWVEVFYPKDLPKNRWLDYYTKYFDTVEINNTQRCLRLCGSKCLAVKGTLKLIGKEIDSPQLHFSNVCRLKFFLPTRLSR